MAYPDFGGVCTSELLVLRPATDVHGRYLFYQLLSEKFIALVTSFTYGAKMPRVGWEQIGNVGVALPPQPEQVAIAAFLDQESAKVDSLVAKKERLIELLREKLLALTGEAVTKGLTRADSTRDSGVRWLGEVPNHWRVVQLRMVIRKFVDYRGATPNKAPSGIPLVTARNIKSGVIDFSESEEFIREEDYASWMVRGLPERGDVLVTTEAPLGESAQVLDETIALAQRIILLKTDRSRLTNAYLKYYLASHAGQAELWSRATGSTALGIKASHLKEVQVAVPPVKEQEAIADFIRVESAKITELIFKIEEHTEKLKEYRTALISAAVTGKIDVRDEVPV